MEHSNCGQYYSAHKNVSRVFIDFSSNNGIYCS